MKNIITVLALILVSLFSYAQQSEKTEVNHSKWEDKINGKAFKMEAVSTRFARATSKELITFSIVGDTTMLSKVSLQDEKQFVTFLPLAHKTQQITVVEGIYTFKFYHQKMGEKVFEVDVKKGDEKKVVLTLR